MKSLVRSASVLLLVLCLYPGAAPASVIIAGTRVVFPSTQGEVTVRLSNSGRQPALVEAWIDSGDAKATPNTTHSPFLITPPLFRLNANKDQSLRILFTGDAAAMPNNCESLFWLNVLEIPPKPKNAAGKNLLQFAIRSRLKLFYRPAKLDGEVLKAPDKLTFKANDDGGVLTLLVRNPTPYYVTISKLSMTINGKPTHADSGMVAPFADLTLALKGLTQLPALGTPIAFTTINDYGASDAHESSVTP